MMRSAIVAAGLLLVAACSPSQDPGSSYTPAPDANGVEDCRQIWVEGKQLPESYAGCWDGRARQAKNVVACVDGQRLTLFEGRYWAMGDKQISDAGDVWADSEFGDALTECLPDESGYIDDFRRSDRILEGDVAPTGQRYAVGGEPRGIRISDGRYVPRVVPGLARILYVTLPASIREISASWVFTDTDRSSTSQQNVVIGATSTAFGGGSIQLAAYAGSWFTRPAAGAVFNSSAPRLRWQLFVVPRPIVDPYPVLASGPLPRGDETGRTGYHMSMRRVGRNTVVVTLPDGTRERVSDKRIGRYWGEIAGYQLRRSNATDGGAEFTFASATSDPGA